MSIDEPERFGHKFIASCIVMIFNSLPDSLSIMFCSFHQFCTVWYHKMHSSTKIPKCFSTRPKINCDSANMTYYSLLCNRQFSCHVLHWSSSCHSAYSPKEGPTVIVSKILSYWINTSCPLILFLSSPKIFCSSNPWVGPSVTLSTITYLSESLPFPTPVMLLECKPSTECLNASTFKDTLKIILHK